MTLYCWPKCPEPLHHLSLLCPHVSFFLFLLIFHRTILYNSSPYDKMKWDRLFFSIPQPALCQCGPGALLLCCAAISWRYYFHKLCMWVDSLLFSGVVSKSSQQLQKIDLCLLLFLIDLIVLSKKFWFKIQVYDFLQTNRPLI